MRHTTPLVAPMILFAVALTLPQLAGAQSSRVVGQGPSTDIPNDTIVVGVHIQHGWNMVSNPVITANDSVPELFPFCYGCGVWVPRPGGYIDDCRLVSGEGRWLKCPGGTTVNITGGSLVVDTITVSSFWNMIGSLSYPVAASTASSIPPGIIGSRFFTFVSGVGYVPMDTLRPGAAYWVRLNQAGQIILSFQF